MLKLLEWWYRRRAAWCGWRSHYYSSRNSDTRGQGVTDYCRANEWTARKLAWMYAADQLYSARVELRHDLEDAR